VCREIGDSQTAGYNLCIPSNKKLKLGDQLLNWDVGTSVLCSTVYSPIYRTSGKPEKLPL